MSLTTFSEYYLLGKSQIELDFVNIFVDKNMDLPLFIDPWAINIRSDLLGKKMYNLIQNYFQLILDSIRSGDSLKAIELLSQTKEFKEIKLGHSKGGDGKGMGGGEYAKHLFDRLKKSKAVSTGMLSHIEDTVLIIEGINYDRISDMIGHILKYELIKYTQQQCYLYRIKTYPRSGTEIRNGEERIDLETVELPYHEESGWIILVPKSIVRKREFSINFDKFYNKYILEFEQTKHLEAGSGLCRVLKSGKKREPTKKDLMLKIPKTKETALTYIEKEPQLLDQYKKALNEEKRDENLLKLFDPMEEEDEENIINNLIKELDLLIPGVDNDAYHNIIVGCLLYIFYPYLENPIKEFEINEGKKRIDISMVNTSKGGFFDSLSKRGIACHRIYFECKNYSSDLKNPEYDQLLGRFSKYNSAVGFIICRSIENKNKMEKIVKDAANKQEKFIWVLTDAEIIDFMKRKLEKKEYQIDQYLEDKFTYLIDK